MSGCLHFYEYYFLCGRSTLGVIAHYVGLSSFLPHPFGSPVFMRVSEPVFACIFQNILTTRQKRGQKWAEVKLY